MSLWADYVSEVLDREVVEREFGFASFVIKDTDCYLEDLYVPPVFRGHHVAHRLADEVKKIARKRGCRTLTTTINCTFKDPTTSLKTSLAYGFKIYSTAVNVIVLRMEV